MTRFSWRENALGFLCDTLIRMRMLRYNERTDKLIDCPGYPGRPLRP